MKKCYGSSSTVFKYTREIVSEPGFVHLTSVTYLQHLLEVGNGEGVYFLLKELSPLLSE